MPTAGQLKYHLYISLILNFRTLISRTSRAEITPVYAKSIYINIIYANGIIKPEMTANDKKGALEVVSKLTIFSFRSGLKPN